MRHLWTEGRYLSAYELHLFSRGAEPINWERHLSVGGTCQLLSDIFQLKGGLYKPKGDWVSYNLRFLPVLSLTLLVCQRGRLNGGQVERGSHCQDARSPLGSRWE